MIRFVQHFWWDAKAAPHFDGKVLKVVMSAKDGTDHDKERGIDRCHDDQGTDAVAPRSILHAPLEAKAG